jgi:type I restriction enzyme, S subunit
MKLPAYPRYKPSGVEWLGDVPEHWEVKRLRWVGDAIIGLTYSPADVVSEGEGTLVLRSSNIQDGRIVQDDNVFVSAEIPHNLRTRANDIVICTRNGSRELVGKTGKISEQETGLTFGAFTAVFRSPANDYMFYVFNSGLFSFQAGLYQTSTIFQLTNGTINAFQIPLPPPAEQQAIAAFLDRETERVDLLVAKKRELIERLKEKRTALISRTVTKGLPPAAARAAGLHANPSLKPSGIEWIGVVPEHWNVCAVWHLFTLGRGRVISHEDIRENPGDFPVYSSQTENDGILGYLGSYDFEGDYVTWTTDGANAGTVFRRTGRFNCTNVCGTLKPTTTGQVDSRFAAYSLNFATSEFVRHDINPKLMNNVMAKIRFAVPPLPEQTAIAVYLDEETAKLDALVGKVEEAVERLQEYRTALITAAVTGKIDVRKESHA